MGDLWLPLADICSDAGLEVRVTSTNAGWETRSRSSGGFDAAPLGVMWHHAASARGANSEGIVNYQVRGNPDAPVGNLTLDRDGSVWPVAAGASNCSGKGGPWQMSRGVVPLDKGNTTLVNVETCNDGVGEPWPTAMVDGYMTLTLALNAWCGNAADDVTTHNAYAPTRKIDPATAGAVEGPWRPASSTSSGTWELADIAAELVARAKPAPIPAPTPTEEDDVVIYALADYTNTWSQQGVALSPEAFAELTRQGAVVVTSAHQGQHIKSLMAISGLTDADLERR
jgi:N-acetylmuramoyl-L-alanine amidase